MSKIFRDVFNGRPRMQVVPDDYLTNIEPMLLCYFTAGAGEHPAAPSLSTVDLLFNNGSPLALARDNKLINIVNPQTGKPYRFMVIGLQGTNTIPAQPAEVVAACNDARKNYNILPGFLFKNGLSAGGKLTLDCVLGAQAANFTAAVEMSTPGTDPADNAANLKAKLWAFHGGSDGGNTPTQDSIDWVNSIWQAKPGFAHLTVYPGGHGNWGIYFDPAYTEVFNGVTMNIWQWAIIVSFDPTFLFSSPGTGSFPVIITPTPMSATAKAAVNVAADGKTATLISSGSTGVRSFFWDVLPPAGAAKPWFTGGRSDGGSDMADKIVNGLTPGDWKFTLTVIDVVNKQYQDAVTVNIPSAGSGTGPVITPTPIPAPTPLPVDTDPIVKVETITISTRQSGKKDLAYK